MKLIIVFLVSIVSLFAEKQENSNTLVCEVLGEESKRIECTFFTQRMNYDRNITFEWKSPSLSEDNRKRKMILSAYHGSLYDYRYYYGRSPGEWHVCIKSADAKLAETSFVIQEHDDEKEY
ncbi:MAG: hypothetical protein U9R50_03075 [Campylobacterota bacterium]|nr:hypothetical protein [Campylobacterota bacterium]